jgi:hypothetical protein
VHPAVVVAERLRQQADALGRMAVKMAQPLPRERSDHRPKTLEADVDFRFYPIRTFRRVILLVE